MRRCLRFLLVLLAGLGLLERAGAGGRTLTVYAAASLTGAFNALEPTFEKANPGWQVRFNYGASSTLRTQIQQGAPADVFASADYDQMKPLADAKWVLAPQTFARNRLALVVPAANPGRLHGPQDLARPGLRIVTTTDVVPIGRYTQQLLANLARQKGYPPDFARRVNGIIVSREANVRSVLAKAELGEADAAVVYETDARASRRVKTIPLPPAANVTAEYPIAVVAGSPNRPQAEAFVRFIRAKEAQAVLRRFGFL